MINKKTRIQVMGPGCSNCKKLFELTKKAVEELNCGLEVEYVTDVEQMMKTGALSSPVLAIDGRAVVEGSIPSVEEIKELIQKAADQDSPQKETSVSGGCSCGHCG